MVRSENESISAGSLSLLSLDIVTEDMHMLQSASSDTFCDISHFE